MTSKPVRSTLAVYLVAALGILWCFLVAVDLVPSLRGDFGWRWPYAAPEWPRLIALLITVVVYLLGAMAFRNSRLIRWWSFFGALLIPLACLNVLGDPFYQLVTRTLSGQANGTHMAGVEITDLLDTLRRWPQIMPTYLEPGAHPMISGHIALSPPGLPILYYVTDRVFATFPSIADALAMPLRLLQCQNYTLMAYDNAQLASAWIQVLMPLWAALTVFPLFRAGGRLAAVWWPLIPSISLFMPLWNTLYPLLAIIAYLWLARGMQGLKRSPIRSGLLLFGSGLLTTLAIFANISTLPLLGLLGFYAIFVWLRRWSKYPVPRREGFRQVVLVGSQYMLGVISLWTLYYLVARVSPFEILSGALSRHLPQERDYLPWIFLHLYDLAMFAGLPIIGISMLRLVPLFRTDRMNLWRKVDPLAAALGLTLLIMALSGTARGETGRVWLFFVPFIMVVAARYFQIWKFVISAADGSRGRGIRYGVAALTLAQAVTLLTLAAFIRAINIEFTPPLANPPALTQNVDLQPAAATPTFGGNLSLTASSAKYSGDGVDLALNWTVQHYSAVPYYASALIVKPDGQPLGEAFNWQPFDTNYPMTCWRTGAQITEVKHLTVGADLPSGTYWISLSLFDPKDKHRLAVTSSEKPGTPQDQYGFPAFTVR